MMLPIVLLGSVMVLYHFFSKCIVGKKPKDPKNPTKKEEKYFKEIQQAIHATTSKIVITTILLLYPGICVRVFQVFKCKELIPKNALFEDSPPLLVLQQDFRVGCYSEGHMPYITLAGCCLGFYVICIPLILYYLLRVR